LKRSFFAAALLGIAFVPFAANAQKHRSSASPASATKPIQIGFAGGAALPTSDLSDGANTGWNITGTVGVSPYAIGGAGWCHSTAALTGVGSGADNNFCWNAGGGISMPLSGFDTFIEARYNQVQGDGGSLKFIPVTFGVMF
jgi:hypothetical protein